MSRNNSTGAYQGFSVAQPFLGASLQWLPAVGTQELDDMVNAFLPGPSSIQDKRAHISMDFFEYSRQTGESFKFYPVPSASFGSATTSSPASSAVLYDSGYASNFNVSPVVANNQWVESPVTFTPVSFGETSVRPPSSSTPKRSAPSSSRHQSTDFSSHPGMRIMTKDGRDVTNSASRGCKTKEQRDHAHLMRIIKACDSCKRKKVRCDPSHKKRAASSQTSPAPSEPKASKRLKKKAADLPPPPPPINEFNLDFITPAESFDVSEMTPSLPSFESSPADLDSLWDQYMQQEAAVFANDYTNYISDDYILFNDQLSHVSPSAGSSSSSPQVYTPYTPAPPGPSPPTVVYETTTPELSQTDPTLPYLNPGVPHGTDYVDFNLFSPPSDFVLDEEPQPVKKRWVSRVQRQQSAASSSNVGGLECLDSAPPLSSNRSPQPDTSASGLGYWERSTSPGVTENAPLFSFTPPLALQTVPSPGVERHDPAGLVLGLGVSQQSTGEDQHSLDRTDPAHGPQYMVQSAVSQSKSPRATVQSSLVAAVRRGVGQDIDQTHSTPPGINCVSSGDSSVISSPRDSSPVTPSSTSVSSVPVNISPTAPGLSSSLQINARTVGQDSSISRPAVNVQTGTPVVVQSSPGVEVAVSAYVSAPATEQHAPLTPTEYYLSGVQQCTGAQGDAVSSPLTAILASTLLSSLPVRRILAGKVGKPGQASSPSSLVSSQLVVLGLVSYLLVCLMGTQYLGSLNGLLTTLITMTAVSLAMMTTHTRRSTLRSAEEVSSTSQPQPQSSTIMNNLKLRVQRVGQRFHDIRCTARRTVSSFARGLSLSRLASAQSLGRL